MGRHTRTSREPSATRLINHTIRWPFTLPLVCQRATIMHAKNPRAAPGFSENRQTLAWLQLYSMHLLTCMAIECANFIILIFFLDDDIEKKNSGESLHWDLCVWFMLLVIIVGQPQNGGTFFRLFFQQQKTPWKLSFSTTVTLKLGHIVNEAFVQRKISHILFVRFGLVEIHSRWCFW